MKTYVFKYVLMVLCVLMVNTTSTAHAQSISSSTTIPKFNKSELSKFLSKNKNMLSLTMGLLIRGSVNGVEWVMNPANSGVKVINKKRYQPMSWT